MGDTDPRVRPLPASAPTPPRPAPAPAVAPRDLLPFPAPAPPGPVARWELPFALRGIPVQFVATRWRAADAAACPFAHAMIPDPERPGECWVIRLVDGATGAVSLPLSPEQAACWPDSAAPAP